MCAGNTPKREINGSRSFCLAVVIFMFFYIFPSARVRDKQLDKKPGLFAPEHFFSRDTHALCGVV